MSQKEGVLSTILFNFSWFEYNNLLHLINMNNYTNKRYISMLLTLERQLELKRKKGTGYIRSGGWEKESEEIQKA